MTVSGDHHDEYHDGFVAGLEWMWGEGFLSPGGAEEVGELLRGVDLTGRRVLDVGCGLGAIDVLLVRQFAAARVVGIDVEAALVERSRQMVAKAGVADRVEIVKVSPGPLPFPDADFDVVFSKDSIIHIPDKAAHYAEVLRVLKPGGVFVGSDWLRGGEGEYSEQMQAWLDIVGLTFEMKNLEQTRQALEQAGFTGVKMRDRNAWYREEIKRELESLSEEKRSALAQRTDAATAEHRYRSTSTKQLAVESGDLRPTHFRAHKPAA